MATIKKTIFQLRERVRKVLKSGRPKQLKKLKKAYGGRYLNNLWASRASFEGLTIAECKDLEGVGNRMKGGHRHNHVRNAHKRMRKCHICGEPIVTGCEVISDWTNAEFMCRECCRNDAEDFCSAVGINFGGVTFLTRRRRK